MMQIMPVKCYHCDSDSLVAICSNCERAFVLVADHLEYKARSDNSRALTVNEMPENFSCQCDFCIEKAAERYVNAVSAGLRQRCCPNCRSEFLYRQGFKR